LLISLQGDELRALRRLQPVCGAFEAARIAYPSIQYSEFPHPEYRKGNELRTARFHSRINCSCCWKVTLHARKAARL